MQILGSVSQSVSRVHLNREKGLQELMELMI